MVNLISLEEKQHITLEEKNQYQKPKYKLETTMNFMFDTIKEKKDYKYTCRQCSSCHGCR